MRSSLAYHQPSFPKLILRVESIAQNPAFAIIITHCAYCALGSQELMLPAHHSPGELPSSPGTVQWRPEPASLVASLQNTHIKETPSRRRQRQKMKVAALCDNRRRG